MATVSTSLLILFHVFFGDDAETMKQIVWCESRFEISAQNPRSSAAGWFQILQGTWKDARVRLGAPVKPFREGRYNAIQNLVTAWYIWQENGFKPWYASRGCWEGK